MSTRHGVEHVQGLLPTNLADDDPARTLTQSAALEQVLKGDPTGSLHIGVPLLEAEEVRFSELVQPQLGFGLQDAGPLTRRDQQRQDSCHCGLAGSGRATDDGVQAGANGRLEEGNGLRRNRPFPRQILQQEKSPQLLLPNGDDERLGDGWENRVQPAPIPERHGDHGIGRIEMLATLLGVVLDQLGQVVFRGVGQRQCFPSISVLEIGGTRPIDVDVFHTIDREQLPERPQRAMRNV